MCTHKKLIQMEADDCTTQRTKQVTVAILLNGFLGAIAAAEEEAAESAAAGSKSKEMLRYQLREG
jgi:hypothetical protein